MPEATTHRRLSINTDQNQTGNTDQNQTGNTDQNQTGKTDWPEECRARMQPDVGSDDSGGLAI